MAKPGYIQELVSDGSVAVIAQSAPLYANHMLRKAEEAMELMAPASFAHKCAVPCQNRNCCHCSSATTKEGQALLNTNQQPTARGFHINLSIKPTAAPPKGNPSNPKSKRNIFTFFKRASRCGYREVV